MCDSHVLSRFPFGVPVSPTGPEEAVLRIGAMHSMNTGKDAVSFALASGWDLDRVRQAFLNAGWTGGSLLLSIEKEGKHQQTKGSHGLIGTTASAVVTFKGRQSDAYWNFDVDPAAGPPTSRRGGRRTRRGRRSTPPNSRLVG